MGGLEKDRYIPPVNMPRDSKNAAAGVKALEKFGQFMDLVWVDPGSDSKIYKTR